MEAKGAFHRDARHGKGDLQFSLPSIMNSHYMKTYVSTNVPSDGDYCYWQRFPDQLKEFIAAVLLHSLYSFSPTYIASAKSLCGNML